MEKTCKTCINLCNKRGEVEGCRKHRSEVQEMIKEIDKKLTVEETVRIIQEEGYYDFERNEIGGLNGRSKNRYNILSKNL
jgi:hypothetical protein